MLSGSLDLTQHRKLNFLCAPFMLFQTTGKEGHTNTHTNTHKARQIGKEKKKKRVAASHRAKQIPRIDFIICVWQLEFLTSAAVNTVAF